MNFKYIKIINVFIKLFSKLFIIINILIVNLFYYKDYSIVRYKPNNDLNKNNYKKFNNKLYKFNYLNIINNLKVFDLGYTYSYKYNIVKIKYSIGFFDEEGNLISPNDFILYYKISVLCNIIIDYNNISIDSLADITINKYFNCIEFSNINEKITLGIQLYNISEDKLINYILLFKDEYFNYNIIKFNDNKIFNSLIINKKFNSILKNINNKKLKDNYKLKNSYIQYPLFSLKRNFKPKKILWKFKNIFGEYFCFCKGQECVYSNIPQICKFNFYVNILDNNRALYLKTHFLFVDFIFSELASDDVYPVFKEMEKMKYPVHYITEKIEIYQKFCNKKRKCLKVILITKENFFDYGDFLQNYLIIILKSKAFISGKPINLNDHKISELFYNIEYITYIAIGHGVCYFKDYLYKEYRLYGSKTNDKILLPPSKKIIFMAKKYGWKDENIIKINLPRWDKYNNKIFSNIKNKFKVESILIMFTWRNIKPKKNISLYYIKNIISLLTNSKLKKTLNKNKITLYFSFHRYIFNKDQIKINETISNNKHINLIDQNEISDCISKTSLVVSDFSSIIFDFMYRRKPFILYIPDANDSNIKNIYLDEYYQLIESLKNGTLYFKNKFFDINSVVKKINYYINNKFKIEQNLVKFYDSFELKKGKNINNFIKYLINLK